MFHTLLKTFQHWFALQEIETAQLQGPVATVPVAAETPTAADTRGATFVQEEEAAAPAAAAAGTAAVEVEEEDLPAPGGNAEAAAASETGVHVCIVP